MLWMNVSLSIFSVDAKDQNGWLCACACVWHAVPLSLSLSGCIEMRSMNALVTLMAERT